MVDLGSDLLGKRAEFKTELPHLDKSRADQTTLIILHELAELPHHPIATNSDRRNLILLTNQSPSETTSELLLVCQYQN
jgi:hypothetical protein